MKRTTMKNRFALLAALLLALLTTLHAADIEQPWMKPDAGAIQNWQDMRFGMFIHWGPSA